MLSTMALVWIVCICIAAIWGSRIGRSADAMLVTLLTGPAGLIVVYYWARERKTPPTR